MADTTTLIRRALDSGIELQFIDGKLRVTGKRSVLKEWAPRIQKHRQRLIEALQPPMQPPDWQPIDFALRACDHFTDDQAARDQMRRDVLATPPHLMPDLVEHFRSAYASPKQHPRAP